MSADRYSECPKCAAKKINHIDEARALYGTIPLEEFERKLKAATILGNEHPVESMREDWEIYRDGNQLIFSYGASCECGFSFSIKKEFKML